MKFTKDLREIKTPRWTGVPFSLADSWVDQRVDPSWKDAEEQSEIHQCCEAAGVLDSTVDPQLSCICSPWLPALLLVPGH